MKKCREMRTGEKKKPDEMPTIKNIHRERQITSFFKRDKGALKKRPRLIKRDHKEIRRTF